MTDGGKERKKGNAGKGRQVGKKKRKPDKGAGEDELLGGRPQPPPGRRRVNLIFAITHPVRRGILRLYVEQGGSLSATEVAKTMDRPVRVVTYHVTVLAGLGALEPDEEPTAGDVTESSYATTIEDDPPIEALLEETREIDEEYRREGKGE